MFKVLFLPLSSALVVSLSDTWISRLWVEVGLASAQTLTEIAGWMLLGNVGEGGYPTAKGGWTFFFNPCPSPLQGRILEAGICLFTSSNLRTVSQWVSDEERVREVDGKGTETLCYPRWLMEMLACTCPLYTTKSSEHAFLSSSPHSLPSLSLSLYLTLPSFIVGGGLLMQTVCYNLIHSSFVKLIVSADVSHFLW